MTTPPDANATTFLQVLSLVAANGYASDVSNAVGTCVRTWRGPGEDFFYSSLSATEGLYRRLMHSCSVGDTPRAMQLLRHCNNAASEWKDRPWNALHEAANAGHAPLVKRLLPHFWSAQWSLYTRDGWSALHLAAVRDHVDVVQVLLVGDDGREEEDEEYEGSSSKADSDTKDGEDAFRHSRGSVDSEEALSAVDERLLSEDSSSPVGGGRISSSSDSSSSNSSTPAVIQSRARVASKSSFNPVSTASPLKTGKKEAARERRSNAFHPLLITDSASSISAGRTPIHEAALCGSLSSLRCLLNFEEEAEEDSDENVEISAESSKSWKTASKNAAAKSLTSKASSSSSSSSRRSPSSIAGRRQATLQARLHCLDGCGDTPLHLAAAMGHLQIVAELLRWGADPTIENIMRGGPSRDVELGKREVSRVGWTPLLLASYYGHPAVIACLLSSMASSPAKERIIEKQLHLRITTPCVFMTEEEPASVQRCYDALGLAIRRGHIETAQLLLSYGAPLNLASTQALLLQTGLRETDVGRRSITPSIDGGIEAGSEDALREHDIALARRTFAALAAAEVEARERARDAAADMEVGFPPAGGIPPPHELRSRLRRALDASQVARRKQRALLSTAGSLMAQPGCYLDKMLLDAPSAFPLVATDAMRPSMTPDTPHLAAAAAAATAGAEPLGGSKHSVAFQCFIRLLYFRVYVLPIMIGSCLWGVVVGGPLLSAVALFLLMLLLGKERALALPLFSLPPPAAVVENRVECRDSTSPPSPFSSPSSDGASLLEVVSTGELNTTPSLVDAALLLQNASSVLLETLASSLHNATPCSPASFNCTASLLDSVDLFSGGDGAAILAAANGSGMGETSNNTSSIATSILNAAIQNLSNDSALNTSTFDATSSSFSSNASCATADLPPAADSWLLKTAISSLTPLLFHPLPIVRFIVAYLDAFVGFALMGLVVWGIYSMCNHALEYVQHHRERAYLSMVALSSLIWFMFGVYNLGSYVVLQFWGGILRNSTNLKEPFTRLSLSLFDPNLSPLLYAPGLAFFGAFPAIFFAIFFIVVVPIIIYATPNVQFQAYRDYIHFRAALPVKVLYYTAVIPVCVWMGGAAIKSYFCGLLPLSGNVPFADLLAHHFLPVTVDDMFTPGGWSHYLMMALIHCIFPDTLFIQLPISLLVLLGQALATASILSETYDMLKYRATDQANATYEFRQASLIFPIWSLAAATLLAHIISPLWALVGLQTRYLGDALNTGSGSFAYESSTHALSAWLPSQANLAVFALYVIPFAIVVIAAVLFWMLSMAASSIAKSIDDVVTRNELHSAGPALRVLWCVMFLILFGSAWCTLSSIRYAMVKQGSLHWDAFTAPALAASPSRLGAVPEAWGGGAHGPNDFYGELNWLPSKKMTPIFQNPLALKTPQRLHEAYNSKGITMPPIILSGATITALGIPIIIIFGAFAAYALYRGLHHAFVCILVHLENEISKHAVANQVSTKINYCLYVLAMAYGGVHAALTRT